MAKWGKAAAKWRGVVADYWNRMTKSWISLATWAVLWIDSSIFSDPDPTLH